MSVGMSVTQQLLVNAKGTHVIYSFAPLIHARFDIWIRGHKIISEKTHEVVLLILQPKNILQPVFSSKNSFISSDYGPIDFAVFWNFVANLLMNANTGSLFINCICKNVQKTRRLHAVKFSSSYLQIQYFNGSKYLCFLVKLLKFFQIVW